MRLGSGRDDLAVGRPSSVASSWTPARRRPSADSARAPARRYGTSSGSIFSIRALVARDLAAAPERRAMRSPSTVWLLTGQRPAGGRGTRSPPRRCRAAATSSTSVACDETVLRSHEERPSYHLELRLSRIATVEVSEASGTRAPCYATATRRSATPSLLRFDEGVEDADSELARIAAPGLNV